MTLPFTQQPHCEYHFLSPAEQLQQRLSECGPPGLLQPELRIIRVADQGPASVQVPVDQRVVSLPPVLQTGVHPLHQEVHHPAIGRVANEQYLWRDKQEVCLMVSCTCAEVLQSVRFLLKAMGAP